MKIIRIIALFIIVVLTACTKGGKLQTLSGAVYTITSTASSRQLVPVIDTTSTGTFTGLYDDDANNLTFIVAWNDLWRDTKKDTITSIAFYGPANSTTNGTLVRLLPFGSTNKASSINLGLSGRTGFTSAEKQDFLGGAYYFTINTAHFPSGIIRGQIAVSKK